MPKSNNFPLVSIIIPSYNHGHYILEAINSAKFQNYPNKEIIVIDDGSNDDTQEILKEIRGIKYIYQNNQGLSAARNSGIKNSIGEFLIFLDADDWLLPDAIEINIKYLLEDDELAFASGAYEIFIMEKGKKIYKYKEINSNYYLHMLESNYIGMIATIMFRRKIFNEFKYDVGLKVCEDYDLYLNILRKYNVCHHGQKIAVYRSHDNNISRNIPIMLSTHLSIQKKQFEKLNTKIEKRAYIDGIIFTKKFFCWHLLIQLFTSKASLNKINIFVIVKNILSLNIDYKYKISLWG